MIALLQRVRHAQVSIAGQCRAQVGSGLLVLLGVGTDDTAADVAWLSRKIVQLRLFADEEGKMNRSVQDVGGELLLISQFTLLGDARKGNRPTYTAAARPEVAVPLYEAMIAQLEAALGRPIGTGVFGADMQVSLCNDGPVTLWLDSRPARPQA